MTTCEKCNKIRGPYGMCFNCKDAPVQKVKGTEDILFYIEKLKNSGLGKAKCLEYLQKFVSGGVVPDLLTEEDTPDNDIEKYRRKAQKWKKRFKSVQNKVRDYERLNDADTANIDREFGQGVSYALYNVLRFFDGYAKTPTEQEFEIFVDTGGCRLCGTQRCDGTWEYAKDGACKTFMDWLKEIPKE